MKYYRTSDRRITFNVASGEHRTKIPTFTFINSMENLIQQVFR